MQNSKRAKKKVSLTNGLPIITCDCGAEILMVTDVKLMAEAIEAHVQWHKLRKKAGVVAELEADRIRDLLTEQVLAKAGEL